MTQIKLKRKCVIATRVGLFINDILQFSYLFYYCAFEFVKKGRKPCGPSLSGSSGLWSIYSDLARRCPKLHLQSGTGRLL